MMMKALEELDTYTAGTGVKSKTCQETKDDLLLAYYKQIERFAKEEQEFIKSIRLDYEISSTEVKELGRRMVAAKKTQTAAFEEIVKLIIKKRVRQ